MSTATKHVLPEPDSRVYIVPIQQNGTVKVCRRDERQEIIVEVVRDDDGEVHLCRECEIRKLGMTPGEGRDTLKELGRRFSPCHNGVSARQHIIAGIGKALHDLWECEGIHPAEIAAEALEDANYHDEAAQLRKLAEG
jgi:hypothetical protein